MNEDIPVIFVWQGFKLEEKKGDLFSCSTSHSLAHCISEDVRMGKGIAVLFKKKFGGVEEIKRQGLFCRIFSVIKHGGDFGIHAYLLEGFQRQKYSNHWQPMCNFHCQTLDDFILILCCTELEYNR